MMNKLSTLIFAACATLALGSCSDDVEGDAYYTFTGDTVASYCASNTDQYSIFSQLLDDTGINSLLSTYGHYTVFLPDDDAFRAYFAAKGLSLETLTTEQKREIVYNHIIKSESTDYESGKFEEGALPEPSMSDNYLVISYTTEATGAGMTIYVNKDVPILERDIEVHNGIIHHVGAVVQPSHDFIKDVLADRKAMGGLSYDIFSQALKATTLCDSIELTYDRSYEVPTANGLGEVAGFTLRYPKTKRYGYTLFAEPDEVMRANGINTLDDLKGFAARYYSSGSDDPANATNALHKFVAYHLLNRQMSTNTFLYSGPAVSPNSAKDRVEFYETMYTFHVIKINVGPIINRSQKALTDGVQIDDSHSNIPAVNGYIHSLRQMLVYDTQRMENDVLNCRFRFDMFNIPPALTNNNIRWGVTDGDMGMTVPPGYCDNYFTWTSETGITMWGSMWWNAHQGDEIKITGWFDFTMRLLPVPPGSYEVRVGYTPEDWRGISQFFIDGEIQGLPRDMRIKGTDPIIGAIPDTGGPEDTENDKAMRNRGYMKAPASVWSTHDNCTMRDITSKMPVRIIIGTVTFQDYGEHFLRAKNVYAADREYTGDYIELVPTSLLDTEDIY